MTGTRLKTQMDKLEKIKQQIKEEQNKIEQDLGKAFLKTFDLTHEDSKKANELLEELLMLHEEHKEVKTKNEVSEKNTYNNLTNNNVTV